MKTLIYALLLAPFVLIPGTLLAGTDQEAAIASGAKRIMGEQIKALYQGQIVSGKTRKGYAYKTPIQTDGSIAANKRRGAGKFLVIDDAACMQFKGLWDDKPMCWSVYKVGKGKYQTFRKNGSLSADIEFLPLK